jgi:hypothetical protein
MNARALLLASLAVTLAACGSSAPPPIPPAAEIPVPPVDRPAKRHPAPQAAAKPTPPPPKPAPIVIEGFSTPESVLWDPVADVYLVSNISGAPPAEDHDGFVSKVSPDGKILELRFIDGKKEKDGLSAPKGTALVGDVLYVADVTRVRTFDRTTGKAKDVMPIAGTTFLNDVAAGPDGAVYVSDMGVKGGPKGFVDSGTDAIYRIKDKKIDKIAKGPSLGRPNGLLVKDSDLFCVTFGSGELLHLGTDGKEKAKPVKAPGGSLDGIVLLPDGRLIFSSWEKESLYARPLAGGDVSVLKDGLKSPADIGYDAKRNRLLVPLFQENKVVFVDL